MTLQPSAPITLAQIATEFGASLPANLGSFLRGGSYVPNTGTNAAVPTALPIDMLDMLGSAAYVPPAGTVVLNDHNLSASRGVGLAKAVYEFQGGGACGEYINTGPFSSYSGEWLTSGLASIFEVRVSALLQGTLTGITAGVWQAANSTWSAKIENGNTGTVIADSCTVELRPAGGGAVVDSCIISFDVERF